MIKRFGWVFVLAGMLSLSLMVACGGGAPVATQTAAGGTTTGGSSGGVSASGQPSGRVMTLSHVEGDVKVAQAVGGSMAAAAQGQHVAEGAQIVTGADGRATLALEDGTQAAMSPGSDLVVTVLSGTSSVPVTKFTLNAGEVFTFHTGALPQGASYEIQTPNGTASIKHSMMQVAFDKGTGKIRLTCLEGECGLGRGDQSVNLQAGQAVDVNGLGDKFDQSFVRNMTPDEINAWVATNVSCACQLDIQPVVEAAETAEAVSADATAQATDEAATEAPTDVATEEMATEAATDDAQATEAPADDATTAP